MKVREPLIRARKARSVGVCKPPPRGKESRKRKWQKTQPSTFRNSGKLSRKATICPARRVPAAGEGGIAENAWAGQMVAEHANKARVCRFWAVSPCATTSTAPAGVEGVAGYFPLERGAGDAGRRWGSRVGKGFSP